MKADAVILIFNKKVKYFIWPCCFSIKQIFDIYGGSTIEVIENGIGKEIENKLNEQFSSQKKDKP